MVVLTRLDDNDIAGAHGIVNPIDGEHTLALDEDKDLVSVLVDVARLGMRGLAGLEDVDTTVADRLVAQQRRQ